METVNLKEFGPIISDRETGFKIYNLIKAKNPHSTIVNIDMDGIKSMATFCAKQIFGKLYIDLTPSVFYNNIKIIRATEDVKLIIRLGIQNDVENL